MNLINFLSKFFVCFNLLMLKFELIKCFEKSIKNSVITENQQNMFLKCVEDFSIKNCLFLLFLNKNQKNLFVKLNQQNEISKFRVYFCFKINSTIFIIFIKKKR